jgi:ankyrin repeat protein
MRITHPIHVHSHTQAMTWTLLLILLLAVPTARAADPLSDALQQGLLAEDVHHDLDAAITAYQSVLAQHDDQRRLVATALFRLGESYRKQGKAADAIAQYQRLLAEFSDQAELARLSRQNLDTLGADIPVATGPLTPAAQRQKDLLAQELALVEQQIAEVQNMIGGGRAGSSDLIPLQREALALQRQMAALDDARRSDLLRDVVLPSTAPVESLEMADGVSEEEAREIQRLKEMIRNSPDLINATARGGTPLYSAASRGQLAVAQFLIENGATVDVRHGDATPLYGAVESGHKAMTELLVAAGADVNTGRRQIGTPLHSAASRGFVEIAKVLLAAGADINATTREGFTPLHQAVMQQRVGMIDFLLDSKADLEAKVSDGQQVWPGYTPLLLAIASFDPLVVERLLARGADVNAISGDGERALHIAVTKDIPGQDLHAILERKPDLETRGSQNSTPLHLACVDRNRNAVRILLEAGANPNAQFGSSSFDVKPQSGAGQRVKTHLGLEGKTPLHWAVAKWDRGMTQLLIEHGANPNATDNDGITPLLGAAMQGIGGGSLGVDPVLMDLLLDAGADPNVRDRSGMTLLQHALRVGSIELVEALLRNGADPNTTDVAGTTPVHATALWPHTNAMELLLEHGAKVDQQDQLGNTPLHVAAFAGNKDAVKLLLDRGAPVNARNQRDQTPLDLAREPVTIYEISPGRGLDEPTGPRRATRRPPSSLTDIVDLLIKHGAEATSAGNAPPPGAVRTIPPRSVRSAAEPAPTEENPTP